MSANEKIPFLDLVTPHKELQQELTAVFQQVITTGGFVGGPLVENFEKDFATFCDSKLCVGVNSGTDAVRFALTAAGVEPGDIVVTVPHTFIATTEAISQAGAHPHFVDIDDRTYTMSPKRLQEYFDRECEIDRASERLRGDLENARRRHAVTSPSWQRALDGFREQARELNRRILTYNLKSPATQFHKLQLDLEAGIRAVCTPKVP